MGRLELPRFDAATANSSRSRLPPRFLLAGLAILTLLGLKLNYHHLSTPPAPPRVNPLRKPTTRIAANTTDYDLQGWFEASRQPGAMQEATLEERLQDWESAPIGELGNWVKFNALNCPKRLEENRNESQLKKAHMLWSSLTSDDIARLRGEMIEVLREAEAEGLMGEKHWGKGRGLVFTAGNADTFERVLLTLKMLHNYLDSPLPSEIFSFPGEECPANVRKELEALGCKLRVVGGAKKDTEKGRMKSYHIKSTAIIRSSFREVLYLDSDNMPVLPLLHAPSNQTTIWDSKAFKRLGAVFWPDYWKTSADNPIWIITGVPCRDEFEQEAGQILIDKSQHLDVLLLVEWLMRTERFKFWYNFSDGDKDLFRYAMYALRKRFGVPGRHLGGGAFPYDTPSGFCGHTMLQHDHYGRPAFVHANLIKQIPSGIGKGYAWGKTRSVADFPSEAKLGIRKDPQGSIREDFEREFEDLDVDVEMLANADDEGVAITPAPPAVRRRAALERGIKGFFHGGSISALCVDMSWFDPREDFVSVPTLEVPRTTTQDGIDIDWQSPLVVEEWNEDPRLSDFEERFFALDGKLSAVGF